MVERGGIVETRRSCTHTLYKSGRWLRHERARGSLTLDVRRMQFTRYPPLIERSKFRRRTARCQRTRYVASDAEEEPCARFVLDLARRKRFKRPVLFR